MQAYFQRFLADHKKLKTEIWDFKSKNEQPKLVRLSPNFVDLQYWWVLQLDQVSAKTDQFRWKYWGFSISHLSNLSSRWKMSRWGNRKSSIFPPKLIRFGWNLVKLQYWCVLQVYKVWWQTDKFRLFIFWMEVSNFGFQFFVIGQESLEMGLHRLQNRWNGSLILNKKLSNLF